ncbi:MAG: 6-carboxytetrahydropterin synthase QueD [candidate division KSB1 bacterium]|nr:6-carboxytetrahydropterin synthase QueD [candidate division KSB1 bacterium]
MYLLRVSTHFDSAHRLAGYSGACERPHGHTWHVQVTVATPELDSVGMGIDFHELEKVVEAVVSHYDHTMLNDLPEFAGQNPTAENLARTLFRQIEAKLPPKCRLVEVEVRESERFSAVYREP